MTVGVVSRLMRSAGFIPVWLAAVGGGAPALSAPLPVPQPVLQVGHGAPVTSLAFSRDGRSLVSGGFDNTAILWEIPSGKIRSVLRGHTGWVQAVAYSPRGDIIATGGSDGARFWDARSGEAKGTVNSYPGPVHALAFTPNGKVLVTGSGSPIALWDTANHDKILDFEAASAEAQCLAITPNGQALIAGYGNGTVKIWNLGTAELKATLPGHGSGVQSIAVSPNAALLASGQSDGRVNVWSTTTRTVRAHIETGGTVYAVTFSSDSQYLATATSDGKVQLWDAKYGEAMGEVESPRQVPLAAAAFSQDGSALAAGGGITGTPGVVHLWDTRALFLKAKAGAIPGGEKVTLLASLTGMTDVVTCLSYSPDESLLATGAGHTLRLWDAATGQLKQTLKGNEQWVQGVAWSPDSKRVAVGGWGNLVRIYDARTGELTGKPGQVRSTSSIIFSPDGSLLAASDDNDATVVWSPEVAHAPLGLKLPAFSPGQVLAISPDNQLLAVACHSRKEIWIFNITTGALLQTLSGHTNVILSITFAPDSQTLASSSWDGDVRLWDTRTGQSAKTLHHDGPARSILFLPGGRTLAVSDMEGKATLWDLDTNTVSALPKAHAPAGVPADILRPLFLAGGGIVIHSTGSGKALATMFPVPHGKPFPTATLEPKVDGAPSRVSWFVQTPEGYFSCPDDALGYLLWNVEGQLYPGNRYAPTMRSPGAVEKALQG